MLSQRAIEAPRMTGAHLAAELDRMGVHFLRSGARVELEAPMAPARLLAGLAMSDEARVRLAMIPCLLLHPEYAAAARAAVKQIPRTPQIVLKCYYTAAMLLQRKYAQQLTALGGLSDCLPDLFSAELGVCVADGQDACLCALAERQALLSGDAINWLGTYEHAIQVLIRQMGYDPAWTQ